MSGIPENEEYWEKTVNGEGRLNVSEIAYPDENNQPCQWRWFAYEGYINQP